MSEVLTILKIYQLHILAPLCLMVWYLHKWDKAMEFHKRDIADHEERLDGHDETLKDHDARIRQTETAICLVEKTKQRG